LQVVQQLLHQLENGWQWRFGFRGLLNERGAVAGLLKISELLTHGGMGVAQDDFAQRVQLRARAAREAEVSEIKQIELAAKRRFRPVRAFGHSGDSAGIGSEPLYDQARLSERASAKDEALCSFDHLHIRLNDGSF
jgi:hypothetical protein